MADSGDTLGVDKPFMEGFNGLQTAGGAMIQAAGSADSSAMLGAAAAAMGPIGAIYLAAYAPAQCSNLASTLLVGGVHAGIGGATEMSSNNYSATDGGD